MPGAILTALLFAANAALARRSALLLGSAPANGWRLLLAAGILGLWAWLQGSGLGGARAWFLLSGIAGFGIGGLAMFHALPRAGSSLSMLIVQCGSAVVAGALEWLWLGTRLAPLEVVCIAVILGGVVLSLAPRGLPKIAPWQLWSGAALAAIAALGQGAGAVLSRKAFFTAASSGLAVDPGTAAFERVLGGLLVALPAWLIFLLMRRLMNKPQQQAKASKGQRAWPWVAGNTLCGPVLGVSAFQWALSSTPAGMVQAIVATAPLLTPPIASTCGEPAPRSRYFAGAGLAVAGTIGLWLV
jgi:drug/metabolite transporter (DMT)-like permease